MINKRSWKIAKKVLSQLILRFKIQQRIQIGQSNSSKSATKKSQAFKSYQTTTIRIAIMTWKLSPRNRTSFGMVISLKRFNSNMELQLKATELLFLKIYIIRSLRRKIFYNSHQDLLLHNLSLQYRSNSIQRTFIESILTHKRNSPKRIMDFVLIAVPISTKNRSYSNQQYQRLNLIQCYYPAKQSVFLKNNLELASVILVRVNFSI